MSEKQEIFDLLFRLSCHLYNRSDIKKVIRLDAKSNEDLKLVIADSKTIVKKIVLSFNKNINALKKCLLNENVINRNDNVLKIVEKLIKRFNENIVYDNDIVALLGKCNSLINVYLCIPHYYSYRHFIDKMKNNYKDYSIYYRGQVDYKYGLLPSFYRGLKTQNRIINVDFIMKQYEKFGLVNLYDKVFMDEKKIDEMFAFFQHTICFSPFLDLTKRFDIAHMFALSKIGRNPNEYNSKDAALFVLSFPKTKKVFGDNYFVRKIRITWIQDKIAINHKIDNDYLYAIDYSCFKCDFRICDKKSNDRMRFQQGAFLLPVQCYIINGQMMIPFDKLMITKIRIPSKEKATIYKSVIKNNERVREEYLMDPYLFFSTHFNES